MGDTIERKLASIRRIAAIEPIPKADRIVCATVDGWKLVTQKSNNFQVGDLVVYFEIDSFLPIHPAFDFLYDSSYKNVEGLGPGYRLKTIKLRGQISQGLILPLQHEVVDGAKGDVDGTTVRWMMPLLERHDYTVVEEPKVSPTTSWDDPNASIVFVEEGDDVTGLLGVKKYEAPISASLAGVVKSTFPSWIKKTDQERVQNIMGKFIRKEPYDHTAPDGTVYHVVPKEGDCWLGHTWEVSMKLDGSSCTIYWNADRDEPFGVCSRNMDLLESEGNAYWQVARKYDLETKLKDLGRNIAIQGELMGPGVQGNRENLKELDLYVFDIYDIDAGSYLNAVVRTDLVLQLGLRHVPVLAVMDLDGTFTVQDFLELANIDSISHPIAEGIVFKSLTDPDISFKAINNNFLLGVGD